MENCKGLKKLLSLSWVYVAFQSLVGAHRARTWIANNLWRVNAGDKVVDVGCGPGSALDYLPKDIKYVGFDISKDYVEAAKKQYSSRNDPVFFVSSVHDLIGMNDPRLINADFVVCNGLLHHLNDEESAEVLRLAHEILKPSGRFISVEPVFLVHQSRFSRWLMSNDRGCNIRTEQHWKDLIGSAFELFTTNILINLMRIPYILIFIEGRKNEDNEK